MAYEGDVTGDLDDRVALRIGDFDAPILESYEVKKSILTQPSTFSARFGWGGVVKDLLSVLIPGTSCSLRIGNTPQFTGFTDGREAEGSVGATELSVFGRDVLARLHDAYVDAEVSFKDKSYAEVVEAMLIATYGPDVALFYDNSANLKVTTGIGVQQNGAPDVDPTQKTKGPTAKVLTAHLGERRYEYLKRQLDRAGLFLWAGGLGEFILTAPNARKAPSYRIVRRRGQTRAAVNVISARWRDDTSGRYSEAIIYGRGGGKKFGRTKVHGSFTDDEMVGYGIDRPMVGRDTNCTNAEQAAFYARRKLAEARRVGWSLVYVCAGHTVPSLQGGERAVWQVDTVVDVVDDEFGIYGPHYIESVTYKRGPQTTTELVLMRPDDLIFASGESD